MHARLAAQEAKIVFESLVILAAMDQLRDLGIERLNPHLELERAGWEPHNDLAQRIRQPVRHHLKMEEETGLAPFEQELEDRPAGMDVQIKGPIHELELPHSPGEQALQMSEQGGQRRLPHRNIQRRKRSEERRVGKEGR